MENKKIQYILAGTVTFGFFFIISLLLFHAVPQENQPVLNVMVGAVGATLAQVIGYFFGSTSGSKDKDKLISDALQSTPAGQQVDTMTVKADEVNVTQ